MAVKYFCCKTVLSFGNSLGFTNFANTLSTCSCCKTIIFGLYTSNANMPVYKVVVNSDSVSLVKNQVMVIEFI